MPPNDTLSRAPPPFAVPRNSSTPCHRASLVDGDGAIIPRQFFSDPGSLCAASPRNFHLFLSSSFHNHPSHSFSFLSFARWFPLLVPLTCFSVPLCHLEEDETETERRGRRLLRWTRIARGKRDKEGRTLERHDKRREESPRRDAGSISCWWEFFRWDRGTGGAGGMPSCRLCFCPLFLFVALQLTTLLLLRKRAVQGRRKRGGEREERENSRDKTASSCW